MLAAMALVLVDPAGVPSVLRAVMYGSRNAPLLIALVDDLRPSAGRMGNRGGPSGILRRSQQGRAAAHANPGPAGRST